MKRLFTYKNGRASTVWRNGFINHTTIQSYNQNTNIEEHITSQSYLYLLELIDFRIGRLQKYLKDNPPGAKELEDESEAVERSTNNAALFREATLRSGLRISDDDIDNAEMTFATQSYTAWLQDNLKSQDWFALHVMNIPRYFGWKMLAATLARSPKTKKDTPFYRYWVEPNNDIEFGVRLSNFLDNNEARYYSPENYRTWTKLFREGLKHEIDSFNSAIGKTLKDVPEGQLWAKLRWKYIQMRIKAKKIFG